MLWSFPLEAGVFQTGSLGGGVHGLEDLWDLGGLGMGHVILNEELRAWAS